MKISKIKIKNLFGIKEEFDLNGNDVEITGKNATGKSSVIDAIRLALTNKSLRECIVNKDAQEGVIYFETDTGMEVRRKKRTAQADSISVTQAGELVRKTTEAFLRELFTPLQLNPIEFLAMDSKEQNRVLLDLIEFHWDLNWIQEQFGEIVPDVNYEQNILRVLFEIQAEDGYYFQKRQDINRNIRNQLAFVEEIANTLPENYNVNYWRKTNLSEIYREIEKIRAENSTIEKAQQFVENSEQKIRGIEADKQIRISAIEKEIMLKRSTVEKEIAGLKEQIKAYEVELSTLEERKLIKIEAVKQKFDMDISAIKNRLEECEPLSKKELCPVSELMDEAKNAEKMKSYINECDRMFSLQKTIEDMRQDSDELTQKIEKARLLPAEILKSAQIPIENLTVEDGTPRINGLPVSNLSDGEKLLLCVEIACLKESKIQLLLLDGVEKLSEENKKIMYKKCKEKGVQIIATRTTEDDVLTVVKL